MLRATSLPVVALCPRVVHHCKLASKGTPLMPASISPIQWKPGTQMGRPLGGLRKAGFDPFEALGEARKSPRHPSRSRPGSPVSPAHNYPDIRQNGLSRLLQTLDMIALTACANVRYLPAIQHQV
jgi:hypothetical protein